MATWDQLRVVGNFGPRICGSCQFTALFHQELVFRLQQYPFPASPALVQKIRVCQSDVTMFRATRSPHAVVPIGLSLSVCLLAVPLFAQSPSLKRRMNNMTRLLSTGWARFSVALALFGVAFPGASALAQQASFGGTVLNEAGEKPVANVEIVLEGANRSVRSDSAGNFVFTGLSAGKVTVLVRHLGFEPLRSEFTLGATQKFEVDLLIKPAVTQLQNVNVKGEVTSPWASRLMDFEERRRTGIGRFLTADFFDEHGRPVSAFLQSKLPGVKFVQAGGRKLMASTRGCGMKCDTVALLEKNSTPRACYMQIVVNGVVRYSGAAGQPMFDVDELNSKDIIGLEFYTVATTPLQYSGGYSDKAACGTVIFWTKGG
jgi:CarboxypepD_reg-like domain